MEETEARVYAWLHGHEARVSRPQEVASPEHHFELYGSKRHFRKADAVLFPSTSGAGMPRPMRIDSAGELVARLARSGLRPLAVDITPSDASIDQGRTTLTVVKTLVPGLLPVSFGYRREPLGMVPRVPLRAKFPHPFP